MAEKHKHAFFMLNLLVRLTGGVPVIKALAETIPQMSVLSKCFNLKPARESKRTLVIQLKNAQCSRAQGEALCMCFVFRRIQVQIRHALNCLHIR